MHTHSSNKLLHKSLPTIFLWMSYWAFAAMLWQILKSHFKRKQSKTDYPENIRKKKNDTTVFFGSWLYAFQWEKTIENHKCIGAGARKVENLVCFLSNFDPLYSESTKKVQNIYWKYWNILQKYWKYWKHVLKPLTYFVLHCIKVLELNCFTLKYIACLSVEHLIKK